MVGVLVVFLCGGGGEWDYNTICAWKPDLSGVGCVMLVLVICLNMHRARHMMELPDWLYLYGVFSVSSRLWSPCSKHAMVG